jgi:hypothetical protein
MSGKPTKSAKPKLHLKQISILQVFLCGLYACVRPFIPTKSNQIAFTSYPDITDNSYAIFEVMMRSSSADKFQFVWLVKNKILAEQRLQLDFPERRSGNVKAVLKNSPRGILAFMRSR